MILACIHQGARPTAERELCPVQLSHRIGARNNRDLRWVMNLPRQRKRCHPRRRPAEKRERGVRAEIRRKINITRYVTRTIARATDGGENRSAVYGVGVGCILEGTSTCVCCEKERKRMRKGRGDDKREENA